ncbi:hypothetical protein Leryth_023175 [Lithospermum erythrorhizon]|nr:hypothetical protein Leryth_023175 [Lithospermum erythrorhizon]
MRVQHGVFGGLPRTTLTKPFNKLAHTPSFNVSLGHVALLEGVGEGLAGVLEGVGEGFVGVLGPPLLFLGGGGHGALVELTRVKKRRLKVMRKAVKARVFEAILERWKIRYSLNPHACEQIVNQNIIIQDKLATHQVG